MHWTEILFFANVAVCADRDKYDNMEFIANRHFLLFFYLLLFFFLVSFGIFEWTKHKNTGFLHTSLIICAIYPSLKSIFRVANL